MAQPAQLPKPYAVAQTVGRLERVRPLGQAVQIGLAKAAKAEGGPTPLDSDPLGGLMKRLSVKISSVPQIKKPKVLAPKF